MGILESSQSAEGDKRRRKCCKNSGRRTMRRWRWRWGWRRRQKPPQPLVVVGFGFCCCLRGATVAGIGCGDGNDGNAFDLFFAPAAIHGDNSIADCDEFASRRGVDGRVFVALGRGSDPGWMVIAGLRSRMPLDREAIVWGTRDYTHLFSKEWFLSNWGERTTGTTLRFTLNPPPSAFTTQSPEERALSRNLINTKFSATSNNIDELFALLNTLRLVLGIKLERCCAPLRDRVVGCSATHDDGSVPCRPLF
ncbi:hypothetical protein DFJ73DRAFT_918030 [Zopfochytrium polystomum]|nr:hypothetical protein DFJ73DRAFT_918030 [Zopfochytrium polystomum]